jgi:hypothetical protein
MSVNLPWFKFRRRHPRTETNSLTSLRRYTIRSYKKSDISASEEWDEVFTYYLTCVDDL